jgi:Outer membrane protein beta-barrel domain
MLRRLTLGFTLACITLLLPVVLLAQEGASAGITVGPTYNFGRFFQDDRLTDSLNVSGKVGFNAHFKFHYGVTDNFGLITGFGISTRSFGDFHDPTKAWDAQSQTATNANLNLTYLEIPFGIQLTSYELGTGLFLYGNAGISIDILAASRFKTDAETVRYSEAIQPLNMSGIGRLGLQWDAFGTGYLDFALSYHHGLFNVLQKNYSASFDLDGAAGILEPTTVKPFEDSRLNTRYISLDIGFVFK